jgi:hypothetical protein
MTRRLALLASVLVVGFTACQSGSTTPGDETSTRTLASMRPLITRSLTPAAAGASFGKPDEITGSGLLIYRYRADSGRTVSLGFPGFAPIMYAKVLKASGEVEDLPLLER